MIPKLWTLILLLIAATIALGGCAMGASVYKYEHHADGSTSVYIKSVNEIEGGMKMGINRDTGTLEITLGNLSKKSEVETVVRGFENVTGNIAAILNPTSGGN